MSVITGHADMIVSAINASGILGVGFAQAQRVYSPRYTIAELKASKRCDVIATTRERSDLDDNHNRIACTSVICLQGFAGTPASKAFCDAMLLLAEQISDFFDRNPIDGWSWDDSQVQPLYDPDDLDKSGVFKTFIRITHSVSRAPQPVD